MPSLPETSGSNATGKESVDIFDSGTQTFFTAQFPIAVYTLLSVGNSAALVGHGAVYLFDPATATWTAYKSPRVAGPEYNFVGYGNFTAFDGKIIGTDGTYLDVFDTASRVFSYEAVLHPIGSPTVLTTDSSVVLLNTFDSTALASVILSPTDYTAPGDPYPPNGITVDHPITRLSWSAVPGATRYDVYLDDRPPIRVTTNELRFSEYQGAISRSWIVVANVPDGAVPGQLWGFNVTPAPNLEASLSPNLFGLIKHPQNQATVYLTVKNLGNSPSPRMRNSSCNHSRIPRRSR